MPIDKVKYIALINVDCDDTALGIVYNWLNNKFTGFVLYHGASYVMEAIAVVVLVSCDWEALIEERRRWTQKDDVYICGVCLGPVPQPLTELPNFTIHAGGDIISGLLYDIEAEFRGVNIT